jgi:hypothetical protein
MDFQDGTPFPIDANVWTFVIGKSSTTLTAVVLKTKQMVDTQRPMLLIHTKQHFCRQ